MNENEHVYCTLCAYGKELIESIMKDGTFDEPKHCVGCLSFNPEDSMPFKDRPNYIPLEK